MSDHYFTAQPSGPERSRTVRFTAYGTEYELDSASTVFAPNRLDPGTAVLFRYAPLPEQLSTGATVLDLGCGYGPITCVLADAVPSAEVWAVDVNQRALELTRRNTERLGVADRVRVRHPDDVPDDVRFDLLWANPPVRVGKAAMQDLLVGWLGRLAVGGEAWFVVGRNLGADSLQRWLVHQGWDCSRVGSAKGFRVFRVGPRPESPD